MSGFSKQIVAATLALVMFGAIALASVGGWALWSPNPTADLAVAQAVIPYEPKPTEKKIDITPPPMEVDVPAFEEPTPVIAVPEQPKEEEPSKKETIKGKGHDRQDAMFTTLMQQFHQDAYMHFVNSPGFGMSRMMPTISLVKREWKMPDWTSEELAKEQPKLKGFKDLDLIHRFSLQDFADSTTKTPQERFAERINAKKAAPKKDHLWEIKSLDLIGLVMHEEPVVYMSDKIPDMKDLKKQPTRTMDLFESEGLEELMNGKTLYVRSKDETIRVLGPINAGKTCLKCHADAKEGAILGAFSYTLRAGHYQSNIRGIPKGFNGFTPPLPVKK